MEQYKNGIAIKSTTIAALTITCIIDNEDPIYIGELRCVKFEATCDDMAACVKSFGTVDLAQLVWWQQELQDMYTKMYGANTCYFGLDQTLVIATAVEKTGQVKLKIGISQNWLKQSHSYEFDLDQSYLPPLISQIGAVLDEASYKPFKN